MLPPDASPRTCRLRLAEIEAWVREHGHRFPPEAQVVVRSLLEEAHSTPLHVNALVDFPNILHRKRDPARVSTAFPVCVPALWLPLLNQNGEEVPRRP